MSAIPANLSRFTGFAECYDAHRPTPPAVLVDLLTQLAGMPRPGLVVDIGCGTGLSTRLWAGRAEKVIGIEPNDDMRHQAEARPADGITYQAGLSTQTGLPDACADIVTCSQSLHWMQPEPTFAEIARILPPGGVFAAIDCDWPPAMNWEVEAAYAAFETRVGRLEKECDCSKGVKKWAKSEHLGRMRDSRRFRFTRELILHQIETGDAARLIGLALSQGSVAALLKHGLGEGEIGLNELRQVAQRVWGEKAVAWYFGYRVRVGVR